MKSNRLLPLPKLPSFPLCSPEVVNVLDRIRFALNSDDKYDEFCYFARMYPRVYRYHLNHAQFRLKQIHKRFEQAHRYFAKKLEKVPDNRFEMSVGDQHSYEVSWDFESYLSAINSALDILARIIGTGYKEQTPPFFNKICAKSNLSGYVDILCDAKRLWVSRFKDYRDCFVHFTPVDTLTLLVCRRYSNGWEVRCKLPINPNIRDILGFRFSRRVELLKYSLTVYHHMQALDKKVAKAIKCAYAKGDYPKRINHLFFIGARQS